MSRHRRILHPTDFSSASGAAFKRAIALAKADKAQMFIAHVIAPPMPLAGEGYMPPPRASTRRRSWRPSRSRRGRPA